MIDFIGKFVNALDFTIQDYPGIEVYPSIEDYLGIEIYKEKSQT
jgi:hypothetical protein